MPLTTRRCVSTWRIIAPIGPSEGSRVTRTGKPWLRYHCPRRAACVDVPEPSIPSSLSFDRRILAKHDIVNESCRTHANGKRNQGSVSDMPLLIHRLERIRIRNLNVIDAIRDRCDTRYNLVAQRGHLSFTSFVGANGAVKSTGNRCRTLSLLFIQVTVAAAHRQTIRLSYRRMAHNRDRKQ